MSIRLGRFWCVLALLLLASCGQRSGAMKPAPASGVEWVDLADGLRVNRQVRTVSVRAWVCLDRGWLEQILCLPGTREHESLMVTTVTPSTIHAALLLIGLEPGQPGRWVERDGAIALTPPSGDDVRVEVHYVDPKTRRPHVDPVSDWIADVATRRAYPSRPFVFGGSRRYDQEGEGSNYAADHTGSVIGLVTFGDEMLGAREVIPDAESVQAQEWVVRVGSVPPVGTEVLVMITPVEP